MFRVGQKVVCVKPIPCTRYNEIVPQVGQIYTVRAVRYFEVVDRTGLLLCEISNPERFYSTGIHEAYFVSTHFRLVMERKTDISIFTAMLNTKHRELCGND